MEIKRELIKVVILKTLADKECGAIELRNRMNSIVSISEASLFSLLVMLEDENFISSYQVKDKNISRKLYKITSLGKMRLEGFEKEYSMMVEVYNYLRR